MTDDGQLDLTLDAQPVTAATTDDPDDFDEPGVVARVALVNRTERTVVVNGRLAVSREGGPGDLSFRVSGPEGTQLPFAARVNVGEPLAEDFLSLAPGSDVAVDIDLRNYFSFDTPGRYRIQATYANRWSGDHVGVGEAWTGTLSSDPVDVDVPDVSTS